MRKIVVFTDGACSMNKTWTGGWSYLVIKNDNGEYVIKGGYEYKSTNNRMELYAILKALYDIKKLEEKYGTKYRVEIVSDSGYATFPFIKYGWLKKWNSGGITTETINYDIWKKLIPIVISYGVRIKFTHIKGHGKNDYEYYNHFNDIVDKRSVYERLKADGLTA